MAAKWWNKIAYSSIRVSACAGAKAETASASRSGTQVYTKPVLPVTVWCLGAPKPNECRGLGTADKPRVRHNGQPAN